MEVSIKHGKNSGFTLIELMIVILIIGILVTAVRPAYQNLIKKSKEAALKENLYVIRDAIDGYSVDHRDDKNLPRYPSRLNDLVDEKYIRFLPIDPITGKEDWETVSSGSGSGADVFDLHSRSTDIGTNGVAYSEW